MQPDENRSPHATPRCGAKTRNGGHCRSYPVQGGKRCRLHGGLTPSAKAAADANILEARIAGELRRMTITPVTNPAQQLARIVGEHIAFLDLARAKLAEVTDDWIRINPIAGTEDVRATIQVYERALDRTTTALDRMCRLGIQDRIARSQQLTAEANLTYLLTLITTAQTHPAADPHQLLAASLEDE